MLHNNSCFEPSQHMELVPDTHDIKKDSLKTKKMKRSEINYAATCRIPTVSSCCGRECLRPPRAGFSATSLPISPFSTISSSSSPTDSRRLPPPDHNDIKTLTWNVNTLNSVIYIHSAEKLISLCMSKCLC